MGGWLSWPPPPSLVMHALRMQSASGKACASIEDEERPTKNRPRRKTPEQGRGWVRTRDIESPRIHTFKLGGQRRISPKFFRTKFFHGRPRGMFVPKCFFFQDLEGLTEVFGQMSAGMISAPKLPLCAGFLFLISGGTKD